MTLRTRRFFFLLFALLFCFSAVIVLLYAQGYRYNFAKYRFEETGNILVETLPRGVGVSLDSGVEVDFWKKAVRGQQPSTPARIKGLLPGTYLVSLAKSGYRSLQKRISIEPGKTAFLVDLLLLKDSPFVHLFDTDAQIISLKQQEKYLYALTRQSLVRYDQSTEHATVIASVPSSLGSFSSMSFSPQGNHILMEGETGALALLTLSGPSIRLLDEALPYKQMRWGEDGVLYSLTADALFQVDLVTFKGIEIAKGSFQDFFVTKDTIWVVQKEGSRFRLVSLAQRGTPDAGNFLESDDISQVRIINTSFPLFTLQVTSQSSRDYTYVIDTSLERHANVVIDGRYDITYRDATTFFAASDYELWYYRISDREYDRQLLTRQSDGISSSSVLKKEVPFVFFTHAGREVVAIEITSGGQPNQHILFSHDVISVIISEDNGKELLIAFGKDGGSVASLSLVD